MADAALARNVTIQYCLASATDILVSLALPAVVQARASPDYVNKVRCTVRQRVTARARVDVRQVAQPSLLCLSHFVTG